MADNEENPSGGDSANGAEVGEGVSAAPGEAGEAKPEAVEGDNHTHDIDRLSDALIELDMEITAFRVLRGQPAKTIREHGLELRRHIKRVRQLLTPAYQESHAIERGEKDFPSTDGADDQAPVIVVHDPPEEVN